VILSKVTSPTAGSTDFALAASTPGWFHGGVFPVADGSLWLAYGASIVHFDPALKAEQDVPMPGPGSAGSAPTVAALMVDDVIWVARFGSHEVERYSTSLAAWLTPVPLPFEVDPESELLVAGSSIVIDGPAPISGDHLSFVTVAGGTTPVVSRPAGDLVSIATTPAGDIVEFGTDATLSVVSPAGRSTTLAVTIPVAELVLGRPWVSDGSGQLWSWVRHFGDSLVRLDPSSGAWSYYRFPDVSVIPEDQATSSDPPQNVVAGPELQTITPTPDGIVVTTRAGENPGMQWPYASAYTLSP
jgi:streptogramin lyase